MAFSNSINKVLSSIKSQSSNISSLISVPRNLKSNVDTNRTQNTKPKWPSLLEQLHWPSVGLFKAEHSQLSQEENDIIDRFIRIVQDEEDDGYNQSVYNHPETQQRQNQTQTQRRRTDREEIRRKLAMGGDEDGFNDASMKKPSLQSRLQNGKNLQICFMNETASDCESQCSDTESTQDRIDDMEGVVTYKDSSKMTGSESEVQCIDFISHQARLQAEARLALSQAKDMARMQMEIEKQNQKKSPITELIKSSFNKIGVPFPAGKRRMSRQILTDMNVAQLQVIVNDLHTQIESLNEDLVQLLLSRDDLHMEQDSMLVDIEDLTKHLGAKQDSNMVNASDSTINPHSNSEALKLTIVPPKTVKLKGLIKK